MYLKVALDKSNRQSKSQQEVCLSEVGSSVKKKKLRNKLRWNEEMDEGVFMNYLYESVSVDSLYNLLTTLKLAPSGV